MLSKATLAKKLSKLKVFENPDPKLEQYPTDSEIAAILIHHAVMQNDIEDKNIVDFGCGTGMLGIGCLLAGAKHVDFLDIDKHALEILKQNLPKDTNHTIHWKALQSMLADTIIMNPPFGVQRAHADKPFLETAMRSASVIYSIHLAGSEQFIDSLASEYGFHRTHTWNESMLLKNTMEHHKKKHKRIDVILIRLAKSVK